MNQLQMNNDNASPNKTKSAFPSLDDSPLWADDFVVPKEPESAKVPPLVIIRAHYPRIAKAIELMWGAPELNEYFRQLVIDERRDRAGFPPEVMAALLKVNAEHNKKFKFTQSDGAQEMYSTDRYNREAFK